MEYIDVYSWNRQLTGQIVERGTPLTGNQYRLVVHVCLFNTEGKMLIQQRQPFKKGWPNLWDLTVGGAVIAGETSQVAAEREVMEEIGYRLELTGVRPGLTVYFPNGFDDVYLFERDIDLDDLQLQYEEVKGVRWVEEAEIIKLIHCGEFIPYEESFIQWLFAAWRQRGFGIRG